MTSSTLKKANDLTLLVERFETLIQLLSENLRETKGGVIPNLTPALGQALMLNLIVPADLAPFIQKMSDDAKKKLGDCKTELAAL